MSSRWAGACAACGHSPREFYEGPLRDFAGRRLCAFCFDREVLAASSPAQRRRYYRRCAAEDGFSPYADRLRERDFAAGNREDFARYVTGGAE